MIPKSTGLIEKLKTQNNVKETNTFKINGKRIGTMINGKEALAQAIELILKTERFEFAIFSSDYGIEFESLFSNSSDLLKARLKMRIDEALSVDERIIGIKSFDVNKDKMRVYASVVVASVYGDIYFEVNI